MTLPFEMYCAMMNAHQFMRDLMFPHRTKRIPKAIRERARDILKHYPLHDDANMMTSLYAEWVEDGRPRKRKEVYYCSQRQGWICNPPRSAETIHPSWELAKYHLSFLKALTKGEKKKAVVAKRKTRRI